jgi:hypothetical protein
VTKSPIIVIVDRLRKQREVKAPLQEVAAAIIRDLQAEGFSIIITPTADNER